MLSYDYPYMVTMPSTPTAINRYLAAIDSPKEKSNHQEAAYSEPALNGESSPMVASNENSEAVVPESSTMRREDLYAGHKVVAMPVPLSEVRQRDPNAYRDPNRPRSLSAGRATTRSRDIVQDVYDRMGVSRESLEGTGPSHQRGRDPTRRGDSSADMFQHRYRAAAALSERRSRSAERGSRRSRSLSRGRSAIAGRWPPAKNQSDSADNDRTPPAEEGDFAVTSPSSRSYEGPTLADQTPLSPKIHPSSNKASSQTYESPRIQRGSSFLSDESDTIKKKKGSDPATVSTKDDQDDRDCDSGSKGSQGKESVNTGPSIKDRISAYSGGKKNSGRNFPQRYPVKYIATGTHRREHPPKIDIFAEARRLGVDDRAPNTSSADDRAKAPTDSGNAGLAPEPSTVPPSPAAAAAASAAAELVRRSTGPSPSNKRKPVASSQAQSTPRAAQGTNATFLARGRAGNGGKNKQVVTQTTSAPVSEIAAITDSGQLPDGISDTSSVSGDDFPPSPRAHREGTLPGSFPVKQSSWSERKKHQKPMQTRSTNGRSTSNSCNDVQSMSSADIEKLVEARVRSQMAEFESRMETNMRRLEIKLEERTKTKLELMEAKLDKMSTLLKALVSAIHDKQIEI